MGVLREENSQAVSVPSVIDTSLFSNDDLELFCESTNFIGKSNLARKTKRKYNLNSSVQKMSEEIFEVSEVDESEYLKIASSAYNDIDVNLKNLSADIEKIFQSFNENTSICDRQSKKAMNRQKKRGQEEKNKEICRKSKQSEVDNINSIRMNCDDCLQSPPAIPSINPASNLLRNSNNLAVVPPRAPVSVVTDLDETHIFLPNVKAKIQFFNQLSKKISKATQRPLSHPPTSFFNDKAHILTLSKQTKQSIKEHPAFSVVDAPKCIKICTQDVSQENHLKPNFVKHRVKQFESKTIGRDTGKSLPTASVPVRMQLDTQGMDLVTKMRCYFDKSSKHLPINTRFKHSSKASPIPTYNDFICCPIKHATDTMSTVSIKSSSNLTKDFLPADDFLETSPALPKRYNPFVESEKSLKKLGDIVHTIRRIREQGMTDVSRDLFKQFRQSLIAANEKLKDSGVLQNNEIICPKKKMVAAVRPHVISNGTFPRILKAIPKTKLNGMDTNVNVNSFKSKSIKDTEYLDRDLLSESELSYERFASALQGEKSAR